MEKLRPGEAVEALMRVALESKTIAGVRLDQAKQENTVHLFDDGRSLQEGQAVFPEDDATYLAMELSYYCNSSA